MIKICKVLCISVLLFLSACGGGAGSDAEFPFQQAFIASLNTATVDQFTVSGSSNGFQVTGSGIATSTALAAGTFLGNAVQRQIYSVNGLLTINGTTQPLNESSASYYDFDYNFLGEAGSSFAIATSPTNLPDIVMIGDSGVLYTANLYSDGTYTQIIGTRTVTFFVQADTESDSALLNITSTEDFTTAPSSVSTDVLRIYTDGTSELVSSTSISGAVELTLTFN